MITRQGTCSFNRALHSFADATKHLFPSVAKFNEIVAVKGEGCYIWDVTGRKYLDFTSGIGVVSTGHCHPKVTAAISEQSKTLLFAQQNIVPLTPPLINLIQRLNDIVPSRLKTYFFTQSGSEAIDNALKLARSHTTRQNVICFNGSYHGRTYGAMSVTTSKTVYRQTFGPLPSGVTTAQYPYCLHCKVRQARGGMGHELVNDDTTASAQKCCEVYKEELHMLLKMQSHPKETAAILIEPILGEGGFLSPPPGFLDHLRTLCDAHGILLIFDEVQSGMGRTGSWWGHQCFTDVQPDIMVFAKGIASGFPFAGLAARNGLCDHMEPGMMGGTYGSHTVGCAAAVATIDAIKEENMIENARDRGKELITGLSKLAREGAPVLEVRGRGLMTALELSGPPGIAAKTVKEAAKRGLLILTCGPRETVRLLPPLVVSSEQVETALNVLGQSLRAAVAS